MATTKTIQPTGATITIPAFTDQPDARVFSTDVDNITEAVNSTNQALSTLNSKIKLSDLGNFASESALETGLDTKLGTMNNGDVVQIQFQMSSATTNFKAYAYVGTLTKITSQYASMNVTVSTSSNVASSVTGSRNSKWKFDELARNSNTTGTCTSTYGTITYVRQANVVTITGSCSGMANNTWVTLCNNAPKCVKSIKFVAFDSSGAKNVSMNIEGTSVQFYGRNESTSCAFGATYITE